MQVLQNYCNYQNYLVKTIKKNIMTTEWGILAMFLIWKFSENHEIINIYKYILDLASNLPNLLFTKFPQKYLHYM